MSNELNMSVTPLAMPPTPAPARTFDACVAAKSRLQIMLSCAFFIYYFSLVIGAGWFRPVMTIQLYGGVNLGIFLAISQYPFVACLAMFYARQMKRLDTEIKALAEAQEI